VRRGVFRAAVAVAVAAGLFVYLRTRRPVLPPPPSESALQALVQRREALQERLREVIVTNGEKSLAQAPRGDIMIGIPTSLTRSILEQVVTGLFGHTTLTLTKLKVHKEGEVNAKVVLRRKTVGRYVIDVHVNQVRGTLEPGRPEVSFQEDRVALSLPVKLAAGSGDADIRLQWDSKGLLANAVCGDVDVTKHVTGGVVPSDYMLNGAFRIKSDGEALALQPDFTEELAIRLFIDPSAQAWQAVDEVVEAQRAACEMALNKINIKEILGQLLGRGFNVKIPKKVIKPVRIPAGVQRSLEIQGIRVALKARPTGLKVASDRLWYGADVSLELTRPAKRAARPEETPARHADPP